MSHTIPTGYLLFDVFIFVVGASLVVGFARRVYSVFSGTD